MSKHFLSIILASLTLTMVGKATANNSCGGLNQPVCKKWEQLRGCDSGLHRTSPIGGTCTYDNKFIPNPIERVIAPAPSPTPQPQPPLVEAPPTAAPGYFNPPAPGRKKGALPHVSTIPPSQPTAMDGIWKLTINGVAYRIEAGRMYSMQEYLHLLVFPVEAYDVVVKDVAQTGPGQLAGYDLALVGAWTAQLQVDSTLAVTVQGMLGPFNGTLTPIQPSNAAWLAQEVAALSGGYQQPAPILPGPPPITAPPPGDTFPPGGGDLPYPPGWGD